MVILATEVCDYYYFFIIYFFFDFLVRRLRRAFFRHVQVMAVAAWFRGQPVKVAWILDVPRYAILEIIEDTITANYQFSGQKVGCRPCRVPQHPAQDRKLRQHIAARRELNRSPSLAC